MLKQTALAVTCVLLSASPASAQLLEVDRTHRFVQAETHGFDYEYDDGLLIEASSIHPTASWNEVRTADQVDYWGFDVALATGELQSQVGSESLVLECESLASTGGNHFSADARGESGFEVRFHVPRRVRCSVEFAAESTYGYNTASVELTTPGGLQIYAADGDYGTTDALVAGGWLLPGDYALRGSAEAFAYGTHNQLDSQSARCLAQLDVFHQLDQQQDGDVDRDDWMQFHAAWIAGLPAADFDGDGDTDARDAGSCRAAWIAYLR